MAAIVMVHLSYIVFSYVNFTNYSNLKWPLNNHHDMAEHICQIKRRSDGNFSRNALTSISSLVAVVFTRLVIWRSKCHQNNSPVVCDGYVKYEEALFDRLHVVAILKKITAATADRVEYSKHPAR